MAVMNKHKVDIVSEVSMPKRGDSLDNPLGHPKEFKLPTMEVVPGKYTNTPYSPRDITDDWKAYDLPDISGQLIKPHSFSHTHPG